MPRVLKSPSISRRLSVEYEALRCDDLVETCLEDLLPAQSEALQVFASYNEDLGPNGHGFRRDESRELKSLCDQAMKGDLSTAAQLRKYAQSLATSCDLLMTDKTNPWLIEELQPWLMQGKYLAQYAEAVTYLAELVANGQINATGY